MLIKVNSLPYDLNVDQNQDSFSHGLSVDQIQTPYPMAWVLINVRLSLYPVTWMLIKAKTLSPMAGVLMKVNSLSYGLNVDQSQDYPMTWMLIKVKTILWLECWLRARLYPMVWVMIKVETFYPTAWVLIKAKTLSELSYDLSVDQRQDFIPWLECWSVNTLSYGLNVDQSQDYPMIWMLIKGKTLSYGLSDDQRKTLSYDLSVGSKARIFIPWLECWSVNCLPYGLNVDQSQDSIFIPWLECWSKSRLFNHIAWILIKVRTLSYDLNVDRCQDSLSQLWLECWSKPRLLI